MFEFDADAVYHAEKAAMRSALVSADPLDAAHAVVTALEPHVEKYSQFIRKSVLTGMNKGEQSNDLKDRIDNALELAYSGAFDGAHHKMWVIDQMVRALTGPGYENWVAEFRNGEDGPDTYEWDEGIAP